MSGMTRFVGMAILLLQFLVGTSVAQAATKTAPQDEMPLLAQVAPEKCVFYLSCDSTALLSADGQAGRLLADPQIKELVQSIDKALRQAIAKDGESEVSKAIYVLAKEFLTRPRCVFVSDIDLVPTGAPTGHAGLMLCLGGDKDTFMESIQTLLEKADAYSKTTTVEIDGKTFKRTPFLPGASLTWGTISWEGKQLFLAGVGDGTVEGMLKRLTLKKPAPAWLTTLKKQLPVQRRMATAYVNLEALKEIIVTLIVEENHMLPKQVEKVLDAIGVWNFKSLQASVGLDETGLVKRVRLETDGPLKGITAALVGSSLTAKDLAVVPADANILASVKLDPVKIYKAVLETANGIDPRTGMELEIQARQLAKATGFGSFEDLLKTVGKTWTLHNSLSEGGTFPTGLTVSVEVNESFAKTRAALENLLEMYSKNDEKAPKLAKKQYKGTEVSYLVFTEEPVPMAPAWCVKDGRLYISLVPQNIFAVLDRDPAKFRPVGDVPEVAKALAQKPMALVYYDPKPVFQVLYPFLPYVANTVAGMLRDKENIDIDAFYVPTLPTLSPYIKPVTHLLRKTDSGIELESHASIPSILSTSGPASILAAFLIPASCSAREAAQRNASMNNMKQIMLAMLNYESAKRTLPPAYSVDKKGKPLLSWRVHILPYLGEQKLYRQFHRDEPWDSPHNKKLIALMPETYRSPMSKAEPGKTTYLTVRTKDSVFPGDAIVTFRSLSRDGTSNTLAVLEVPDKLAVPWTKPDDYVPDKDDPMKGLEGIYGDKFLAAFCDGSVHTLSIHLSRKTFDALVTRNGGEPVDFEDFEIDD